MTATTDTWIRAVRSSHERLSAILRPLSAAEVALPSYDHDWSVADVASHLGSQAEIFTLVLEAGLNGDPAPGREAFPPVWERWNALPPVEQARRSVEANEAFVSRVEQTSDEERERFALAVFGRAPGLVGMLAARLSEHAVHTWDVAVALDGSATVAPDAVALLVDELPGTVARGGRAIPGTDPVALVTADPARTFVLDVGGPVTLEPSDAAGPDPLVLPAEALVRLVYGRLDAGHAPVGVDDPGLDRLRTAFPGF